MNFEREEMCVDEVEVSIKNIIVQSIRKIGVAFVCTLIFAIVLPCLVYVINLGEYNSQNSGEKVELTEEEALGVKDYLLLKEQLAFLKEYEERSMYFEMDSYNVYQGKVQFYVKASGEEKNNIANVITNYINNSAFSKQLSEELEYVHQKYAYELVQAEVVNKDTAIINVSVYASDETKCEEIVVAIKKIIKKYSEEIQLTMHEHEVVVVEESYICGFIEDVYKIQSNYVYNTATLLAKIGDYEGAFSEGQRMAVYEATGDERFSNLMKPEKPRFSLLFLVLGGVIGFIIGIGIIVVITIFNGKIQSEKELSKRLNIDCLGSLRIGKIGKRDKFIDKYLYKVETTDREVETLCARVQLCLKDAPNKKVELISTADVFSDSMVEKLQETMRVKGIKCEVIGNIVKDAIALERISESENIVLVEKIDKSRVKDIYEEAQICVEVDASVIGYILVRA